jgi:hypothetical protein
MNRKGRLVIPDNAIIRKANDNPTAVAFGVAVTEKDKRARLEILTERYLEVGYIQPDDPHIIDGVYRDEWEDVSIPIVAKYGDRVVASLRLTPNLQGHHLLVNGPRVAIDPDWRDKIAQIPFEISQLAKVEDINGNKLTLGILRAYIATSRSQGQNEAVAVIDNSAWRIMNGDILRFNLPQIGPALMYLGSESVPAYINIQSALDNMGRGGERSKQIAQFLDTGKAIGFEWYHGL